MACTSGTSPVCLDDLVSLVYLVHLVSLVGLVQPHNRDRPNRPDRPTNGLIVLAGFFSTLLEFPPRQHTSQGNQWSEALYIFRNPCHDLIGQSLILKTLVGIIKKTAPE